MTDEELSRIAREFGPTGHDERARLSYRPAPYSDEDARGGPLRTVQAVSIEQAEVLDGIHGVLVELLQEIREFRFALGAVLGA